jgi:hypothetical protein
MWYEIIFTGPERGSAMIVHEHKTNIRKKTDFLIKYLLIGRQASLRGLPQVSSFPNLTGLCDFVLFGIASLEDYILLITPGLVFIVL